VGAWLERLEISDLARRQASQLSGGEAQRVSLARAFVLEPELLLLDEPFASVDPPSRARLLDDLARLLSDDHRTAVFVTHNLKEAGRFGQRIAVMVSGILRQVGSVRQVKSNPRDEEIAMFMRELND
jgi:tungstate transport system ATP-binding protein